MDRVARLSAKDRHDLFNEASARRGLEAAVIEKDFWVCWTLKRLFALPQGAHIVFKGGTSLSKVFAAIARFSEDIDLSFDRRALGFEGDRDPANAPSRKQAQQRIEELVASVQKQIATVLLPGLAGAITQELGEHGTNWALTIDAADPQTLNFEYPSLARTGTQSQAYIRPVVRLELGARGDAWPTFDGTIKAYAADEFPEQFADPTCAVQTLAAERTFWEKATILHAEYHRPPDKNSGDRLSRHYYDLASLADSEHGGRAIEQIDLLASVVRHKMLFFPAAWAQYETAKPGTLRLVPTEERLRALRSDYAKMQPMFFARPPSFEDVIERLRKLEGLINDRAQNDKEGRPQLESGHRSGQE
jgi:hypothetical protein